MVENVFEVINALSETKNIPKLWHDFRFKRESIIMTPVVVMVFIVLVSTTIDPTTMPKLTQAFKVALLGRV